MASLESAEFKRLICVYVSEAFNKSRVHKLNYWPERQWTFQVQIPVNHTALFLPMETMTSPHRARPCKECPNKWDPVICLNPCQIQMVYMPEKVARPATMSTKMITTTKMWPLIAERYGRRVSSLSDCSRGSNGEWRALFCNLAVIMCLKNTGGANGIGHSHHSFPQGPQKRKPTSRENHTRGISPTTITHIE